MRPSWADVTEEEFGAPMVVLTAEEVEAEQLFLEAIRRRLTKVEACILARDLERRSPLAGSYLRWLLVRFRPILSAQGSTQFI